MHIFRVPLFAYPSTRRLNPSLRGWLNYYGRLYKSAMRQIFNHLDQHLLCWVQRKYRQFARHSCQARRWLKEVVRRQRRLFIHWLAFWQSRGPDDGSRMTGGGHVRFCVGLGCNLPDLLSIAHFEIEVYCLAMGGWLRRCLQRTCVSGI